MASFFCVNSFGQSFGPIFQAWSKFFSAIVSSFAQNPGCSCAVSTYLASREFTAKKTPCKDGAFWSQRNLLPNDRALTAQYCIQTATTFSAWGPF